MFDFMSAHVREKWGYCRMLAKKDEKGEVSKFWICTEDWCTFLREKGAPSTENNSTFFFFIESV